MSKSSPKRILSFRALLTGSLVLLLVSTAAGLVGLGTWLSSRGLNDLTQTVAEQTLARVRSKLEQSLERAEDQSRQTLQVLGSRSLSPSEFPAAGDFLAESLKAEPTLARLTWVAIDSGEFVQAERRTHGQIWIVEGYSENDVSLKVIASPWNAGHRGSSIVRKQPRSALLEESGFREARQRARGGWGDAYPWEDSGTWSQWAIRHVLPVPDADGKVRALVGTSLTLANLNQDLLALDHQVPGYVAIVEEGLEGGQMRLLGHPNTQHVGLLTSTNSPGDTILKGYVSALMSDPLFGSGQFRFGDYGRPFKIGAVRYVGSFLRLDPVESPRWILLMMIPLSEIAGDMEQHLQWAAALTIGFLIIAVVTAFGLARRIAEPMRQLSLEAHALSQLQITPRSRPWSSIREVRQLEQSLEDARTSLRSFRKYVPADLVNRLIASGSEARLGGQSVRLTLLFTDVIDFTQMAEAEPAQRLVEHLGEYLAAVSTLIQKNQGTVDKYMGDGIMAFWGAPRPNTNHALDACLAALQIQKSLDALNTRWVQEGKPAFHTRIGLNTGTVVVGNIGSETRMNYTAVGDAVNLASRLESLNRTFGTRILISEDTRMAAGDALLTRPVGRIAVKGSQRGIVVHELMGLEAEADAYSQHLAEETLAAFFACDTGRLQEALQRYESILKDYPEDPVARSQRDFLLEQHQDNAQLDSGFIRRMKSK